MQTALALIDPQNGLFLTDDFQVVQSMLEVLAHHFVHIHEDTHLPS
jgi:hypothetical protein